MSDENMSDPKNDDDSANPGPSQLPILQERKAMYEQANANAEAAGDSPKQRRMRRGIEILINLCKKVESGQLVEEEEIPPPVALSTSYKKSAQHVIPPTKQVSAKQSTTETEDNNQQSGLEAKLETDDEPYESAEGDSSTNPIRPAVSTGTQDDSDGQGGSLDEEMESMSVDDETSCSSDVTMSLKTQKKRKEFDVTLVFAEIDSEKADEVLGDMEEKIQFKDRSKARVVLYDHPAFGVNKVRRPSIICEKSFFIFILHTEHLEDDVVAEFTKDETIAHTRIMHLFHKSDSVRSLKECAESIKTDLPPVTGLAAVAPIHWNPHDETSRNNLCHLLQFQRDEEDRQNDDSLGTYEIKITTRGICLIINNIEFRKYEKGKWVEKPKLSRYSAELESDYLATRFKRFRYEVRAMKNQTAEEMERLMDDIAKIYDISKKKNEEYDSFVCFLLSHGQRNVIYGSDCVKIGIHNLFARIMPNKCPALKGKPKLFFIDACRIEYVGLLDQVKCSFNKSQLTDFYICYGTSPGELSRKNNEKGDWFTNELIETLETKSTSSDLTGIMQHVKHQISKRRMVDMEGQWHTQKPDIVDRLRHKFYFAKPGNSQSKSNDELDQLHYENFQRTEVSVPTQCSNTAPFQDIALDMLGPFGDPTKAGCQYILVLTDTVTQWIEAEVIPNNNSGTIMECLIKFVCKYGTPQSFITSTEQDFSQKLKTVCSCMGVGHRTTSLETPLREIARKYNGKLCSLISDFVRDRQSDWDVKLPFLLSVYRTSVHELIKTDPFFSVFGRRARLPGQDAQGGVQGDSEESNIMEKVDAFIKLTEKMKQEVDNMSLGDGI